MAYNQAAADIRGNAETYTRNLPTVDNSRRLSGETAALLVVYMALAIAGAMIDPYTRLMNVQFLIPVTMAVGLALMWGMGGILSFGQSLFYGLGGYAYGVVAINLTGAGETTNLALLAGIAVPTLAALGIGWFVFYARLNSVYVAIVMFVLTIAVYSFMSQTAGAQWHIGKAFLGGTNGLGSSNGAVTPPPSLRLGAGWVEFDLSSDSYGFFLLVLTLAVGSIGVARAIVLSRWGLMLRAVKENPSRAEAMGYDQRLLKMWAFVFGGLLAGISGVMFVSWSNFITPDVFSVTAAILPVLWVTVGGTQSIVGSAVSAAGLSWLTLYLGTQGNLSNVVIGALLVVVAVLAPRGFGPMIAGVLQKLLPVSRLVSDGHATPETTQAALRPASLHRRASADATADAAPILAIEGITKSWRGVSALTDVSFSVRPNEIVCIIGPNGAGKSTLLKCITGDVTPEEGSVVLGASDVSGVSKFQRARRGIGIKYQNGGVCPALSVLENLALAAYSPARRHGAGRDAAVDVSALPVQIRRLLDERGPSKLGDLAHGSQQLIDIGMALECLPRVLILDEPVAGLSVGESAYIARLIRHIADDLGIAVLVTEHDMAFVQMLEARIIVLHHGKVLATGNYQEMMDNPDVKRVYLGSQESEPGQKR